jgi:hypothetical protein
MLPHLGMSSFVSPAAKGEAAAGEVLTFEYGRNPRLWLRVKRKQESRN